MNVKKLLSAAAMLTCVAALTLPASATSTTGTVTVKWNVTALLSLQFQGNYTNTGTSGATLDPTPLVGLNGGAGACGGGGTGGGGASSTALTLDFGAITPDAVNPTDCLVLNAAEAVVNTNDANGVLISEALTTAPTGAGISICGATVKSNAPVAWVGAGAGVSTSNYTAAKATDTTTTGTISGTTCAGMKYGTTSMNAQAIVAAGANAFKSSDDATNPAYYGQDIAVIVPANAASSAGDSAVITYTVTGN